MEVVSFKTMSCEPPECQPPSLPPLASLDAVFLIVVVLGLMQLLLRMVCSNRDARSLPAAPPPSLVEPPMEPKVASSVDDADPPAYHEVTAV